MSKKEVVIETARELFTKYGYRKVSMDEIAKSAGVTKKTVYSYFKDKDSIFLYFVDEELASIKVKLEATRNETDSFIEIIASDIYQVLTLRKNSMLISNIANEVKNNNSLICSKFLKLYDDNIISYIEGEVKKEIANKKIRECDPHLVAFVIYKLFLSVVFEYDGEINEEKLTKEITSILKEGLLI